MTMITYKTYEEEWGTETEYTCTCDGCGHEMNAEDLYECEHKMYCADCLRKMFPSFEDNDGYECLNLGDGMYCYVDDLGLHFPEIDPWDMDKWECKNEPDWDLMAKDKKFLWN